MYCIHILSANKHFLKGNLTGLPISRVKGKDGGVRGSGRKVGGWGVVACAPSKAPQPPSDGQ